MHKNNKKTIENKLKELDNSFKNEKITILRTANQRIVDAKILPPLQPLYGEHWFSGDLAILAGDTGVGKTILANEIANSICSNQKVLHNQKVGACLIVLYYDLELRDEHFLQRYQNKEFADKFYSVIYNNRYIGEKPFSIEDIIEDIEKTNANAVIIDNISALEIKTSQDADSAKRIINDLKKLRNMGISTLILAHTPKIPRNIPLDINHIAGSKYLVNLVDSAFIIARSNENIKYRYIKNLKPRNTADSDQVLVLELIENNGNIGFEFVKMDYEKNHIKIQSYYENDALVEEIARLLSEKVSCRKIEKKLGVSKSSVNRIKKKIDKKNNLSQP